MVAKRPSFLGIWFVLAVLCSIPVLWQHKNEMAAPVALSFVLAIGYSLYQKYNPSDFAELNTKYKILKLFIGVWGLCFFVFANQLFRFHFMPFSAPQLPSAREVVGDGVLVTICSAIITFVAWNALREKKTITSLFGSGAASPSK
jgi:predicted membrane protein